MWVSALLVSQLVCGCKYMLRLQVDRMGLSDPKDAAPTELLLRVIENLISDGRYSKRDIKIVKSNGKNQVFKTWGIHRVNKCADVPTYEPNNEPYEMDGAQTHFTKLKITAAFYWSLIMSQTTYLTRSPTAAPKPLPGCTLSWYIETVDNCGCKGRCRQTIGFRLHELPLYEMQPSQHFWIPDRA